ncbi:hypothetical protein SEVIR_5G286901v4 [Setaria viridis]
MRGIHILVVSTSSSFGRSSALNRVSAGATGLALFYRPCVRRWFIRCLVSSVQKVETGPCVADHRRRYCLAPTRKRNRSSGCTFLDLSWPPAGEKWPDRAVAPRRTGVYSGHAPDARTGFHSAASMRMRFFAVLPVHWPPSRFCFE